MARKTKAPQELIGSRGETVVGLTVRVDMEIDRFNRRPDGLVEVWGFVGDYEVCLWLSTARFQELLREAAVPV